MNDQLLTAKQVAELLSCSFRHVIRLADRGIIPKPIRLGSSVRWSKAALEKWIKEQQP